MAVSRIATGAASSGGGNTTTATPTAPTHAAGDMIVVAVAWDPANNTAGSSGITASAGWSAAPDTAELTSTNPRLFVKLFYKFATSGSEAMPTITFTGGTSGNSGHSFIVWATSWRGVDATAPFGTSGATVTDPVLDTSHLSIPSPGSVTAGDAVLGIELRSDDACTYTTPANWSTDLATTQNAAGADNSAASAYRVLATTSDPGALTYTGGTTSTLGVGRMWRINAEPAPESKSGSDSGSLSEAASGQASPALTDAGSTTEAATGEAQVGLQDTAAFSETAERAELYEASDAAALAEAATVDRASAPGAEEIDTQESADVAVSAAVADQAAVADAASVETTLAADDTAAIADTASGQVPHSRVDAAALTDTSSVSEGESNKAAADTAALGESADLVVELAPTDTAIGTDSPVLEITVATVDVADASELAIVFDGADRQAEDSITFTATADVDREYAGAIAGLEARAVVGRPVSSRSGGAGAGAGRIAPSKTGRPL